MGTVAIRRYEHSWQAHVDRACLAEHGIDSRICDEGLATLYGDGGAVAPHFAAELHVGEDDAEEARTALSAIGQAARPSRASLIQYDVFAVVALLVVAQLVFVLPWLGVPLAVLLAGVLARQFRRGVRIRRELRSTGQHVDLREARWLARHAWRDWSREAASWTDGESGNDEVGEPLRR